MSKTCPICSIALTQKRVQSFEVDACTSCGGLWLDAGELNGLRGEPVEAGLRVGSVPTECRYCNTSILSGKNCIGCNRPSIANCANNHGPMNSAIIENSDGEVEVDVCGLCSGIWLDGHELHLASRAKDQIQAKPQEKSKVPQMYIPPKTTMDHWQRYDSGFEHSSSTLLRLVAGESHSLSRMGTPTSGALVIFGFFGIVGIYLLNKFLIPALTF